MSNKFQVPSSLTLEPNPFEQSFAGKSLSADGALPAQSPLPQQQTPQQQRLPGVQGLTSPAPIINPSGQWQSTPRLESQIVPGSEPYAIPAPIKESADSSGRTKRKSMGSKSATDQEKKDRRLFLERNRIAAVKCRQRKKQWVDDLKQRVEYFQAANEELVTECTRLKTGMDQIKQYLYSVQDPRRIPPQIIALLETPMPVPTQVQPVGTPGQQQQQSQVQQPHQNVIVMVPQQQMMVQNNSRPA